MKVGGVPKDVEWMVTGTAVLKRHSAIIARNRGKQTAIGAKKEHMIAMQCKK